MQTIRSVLVDVLIIISAVIISVFLRDNFETSLERIVGLVSLLLV